MNYITIIEHAGDNLSAYFPDVPGCYTVGDTFEEILVNAAEVLAYHLEDEIPPPAARPLKAIIDEGLELDDTEIVTWISYVPAGTLTPA